MRIVIALLSLMILSSCSSSRERTGESVLFDSGKIKVVVVQFYEDMPWHYYGLRHEVWCKSESTADMQRGVMDRGWNMIGYSGVSEPGQSPTNATKKKSLDAAVLEQKKQLVFLDEETIVQAGGGILTVTFNGCKSFSIWNGWELPEQLVIQAAKSQNCVNNHCPWENYAGERQISFSNINVDTHSKHISFLARSKGFRDGELLISSVDAGRRWLVANKQGGK